MDFRVLVGERAVLFLKKKVKGVRKAGAEFNSRSNRKGFIKDRVATVAVLQKGSFDLNSPFCAYITSSCTENKLSP